jgi:predicted amidohydrolase
VTTIRIGLANLPFPSTPQESVALAEQAVEQASVEGVALICFPECFIPGYRSVGKQVPPPDSVFLERAWSGARSTDSPSNA